MENKKKVADLKATIAARESVKRDLENYAFTLFATRIDALEAEIRELRAELTRLEKGE